MKRIVGVKPGEGGDDAEAFADDITLAIGRWASSKGMTVTVTDNLTGRTFTVGGSKEWV